MSEHHGDTHPHEDSPNRDLNRGPVWRAIARISAPMSLGILGVLMVGLVDAFFLARIGAAELTAIGFIFPVIATLISLSIGLSAGANALVSNSLGRGASDTEAGRLAFHAVLLAAALACAMTTVFYFAAPALFGLMGARGAVLDAVMDYIPYWCASFPFLVAGMVINAAFRAGGRGGVAASVMVFQSALNIALDPLLIFGAGPIPAMEASGAGLATLLARAASFTAVALYARRSGILRSGGRPLAGFGRSARRILRVGVPASLSNAINPAGMAVVTGAVAVVGETAVAGFGAATRVQQLTFVPLLALSAGIGPVVGQAWGKGDTARAQRGVQLTHLACLAYGLAAALALTLAAGPIARAMTNGVAAEPYVASYLRIVGWSFFGYGVLVTANAAMNARDRALWSMGLSALRIGALYIPLAWAGVLVFGYAGVLWATVAANILAAWAALIAVQSVGLSDRSALPVAAPARWLAARLPGRRMGRPRPRAAN